MTAVPKKIIPKVQSPLSWGQEIAWRDMEGSLSLFEGQLLWHLETKSVTSLPFIRQVLFY